VNTRVLGYIAVMALVTYAIRVLPLTLIRREISSPFLRSFLYYVPYVTLAVMIFPGILSATGRFWSGLLALGAAAAAGFLGGSLVQVAGAACGAVFLLELFLL
jgi:branched-subunit amino acid transport protein